MAWMSWAKLCMPKTEGGMGFRDLRSFNLALLAKQLWRILTLPNLLLSQVIKARYFPSGDILRACLGSRPSATWRSLLKARPCLVDGLRRRIGDGLDTSIWADPWLRDDGNFRIITRRPFFSHFPDTVSDIIDQDSRSWNFNLVESSFWPVDHGRIFEIPIGSRSVKDAWVWHFSQHGKFTVRSCYHNLVKRNLLLRGESGVVGGLSIVQSRRWKALWDLRIPPKIRSFLWRACSEILPTGAELFRRRILPTPACPRCGFHTETLLHAVLDCGGIRSIWCSPHFTAIQTGSFSSLWQWFDHVQLTLSEECFLVAIVAIWKLWERRNRELHGEEAIAAEDVLVWSQRYMNSYNQAQFVFIPGDRRNFQHVWNRPDEGVIKVNFDAAIPRGEDYNSVAMVARDWNGVCLWWAVRRIKGRPQVVECEAHAALEAMIQAQAQGWYSIVLEGDSLQVIESLKTGISPMSSYGAFIENILAMADSFHFCEFSFVKRSGNQLAHGLASSFDLMCNEGSTLPPALALYAQ